VSRPAELVTRFIAFKDGSAKTYGYMVSKEGDLWDGALVTWANERERMLKEKGIHPRGFNRDTPGRQAEAQGATQEQRPGRDELNRAGTSTGDSRTGEASVVHGAPGSVHAHPHTDTAGESATDRRKELTTGAPGSASSPQVRDTSLDAYRSLKDSGKLSAQQLAIVEHFASARPGLRATRQELARDLEIGINAICGRVVELLTAEPPILIERGRKRCSVTGNDVTALELAA
jgi:hypothetical protein